MSMETFDFCVRLDDLIEGCLEGGNTIEELQLAMIDTIKRLETEKKNGMCNAEKFR